MKQKLCLVVCILSMLVCMAGCGGESTVEPEPAPNPGEAAEAITGLPGVDESESEDVQVSQTSDETDPVLGLDGNIPDASGELPDAEPEDIPEIDPEEISGIYAAHIDVRGYGTIEADLYADIAPVTVANFVNLANAGFYDGLTFHRIMDGFMIQGGDPLGNGLGGASKDIVGEFAENGYENNLSHVRGTLSMARAASNPDSASSQFFIVQTDSTFLDGSYAAFGTVISGMEIVDAICQDAEPVDDNGTILSEDQPVIDKITVEKLEDASVLDLD